MRVMTCDCGARIMHVDSRFGLFLEKIHTQGRMWCVHGEAQPPGREMALDFFQKSGEPMHVFAFPESGATSCCNVLLCEAFRSTSPFIQGPGLCNSWER